MILLPSFVARVVDTGDATGIVDIGGTFATVLLIPVVRLDLQISPRIFAKN
jgi:hypothetical protein